MYTLFLALILGQAPDYPLSLEKEQIRLPEVAGLPELKSPKTIFYKLPGAYQFYQPKTRVEHTNLTYGTKTYTGLPASFKLLSVDVLEDFNSNKSFPWATTFGLDHAHKADPKMYSTINFRYLPDKPIVILNERPYKWVNPFQAKYGEIIIEKDSQGRKWVMEVRVRTKMSTGEWEVKIYAPIGTRKELMRLVGEYTPAKKYLYLRNNEEDEVMRIQGMVERIPNYSERTVKWLLNRTFKDVTEMSWSDVCTVPCSDQPFNLFPKNYSRGLLSPDPHSCSDCHRQTQIASIHLTPRDPVLLKEPEKIGAIRGSDGIFTWHPFDPNSISDDFDGPQKPIKFNRYDIEHKHIELYKPESHQGYKLTQYVQNSLQGWELPQDKRILWPVNVQAANLLKLYPNDRKVAERQGKCDCGKELGSDGVPVQRGDHFFCSEHCALAY